MSRFYVPKENITGKKIIVDGNEAHHILDVMRLKEGDKVVVFDGTGKEYSGSISSVSGNGKSAEIEVEKVLEKGSVSGVRVTIAQSIPKKDKMEYLIQKAVELGVYSIIPMVTDRTIVRPDDKGCLKKVLRWQKIALEAAKQCGRTDVPEIKSVVKFEETVNQCDFFDVVYFACLSDITRSFKEVLSSDAPDRILVVIGPEGGFSEKEIDLARRKGSTMVSFGKRVLKSDTAGLFALSVLGYEYSI